MSRRRTPLPTLSFPVRCEGQSHTVLYTRGRLVLLNHSITDRTFRHLLDTPCRCLQIITTVRNRLWISNEEPRLPRRLVHTLRQSCSEAILNARHANEINTEPLDLSYRLHRFTQITKRELTPLSDFVYARGMSIQGHLLLAQTPPTIRPVLITPGHTNLALATRSQGTWHLCTTTLKFLATEMPNQDNNLWILPDSQQCSVCPHKMVLGTKSLHRHIQDPRHYQTIVLLLQEAFTTFKLPYTETPSYE